jgi:hypothetical protein
MCTQVYFKTEKKIITGLGELADMLGGREALVISEPDEYPPIEELWDGCLCPVDIRATFAKTEYIMSQWEDGFDWTARKPNWLVEEEEKKRDRERYDAAMTEMRKSAPHA